MILGSKLARAPQTIVIQKMADLMHGTQLDVWADQIYLDRNVTALEEELAVPVTEGSMSNRNDRQPPVLVDSINCRNRVAHGLTVRS